ncbi:hypothetical protein FQN50_003855 [Emmonsiellopsis sp. PD_5]|nr:hypothetical protein FQN50_003855 [Emmonsiellopsis sp. PD_5]
MRTSSPLSPCKIMHIFQPNLALPQIPPQDVELNPRRPRHWPRQLQRLSRFLDGYPERRQIDLLKVDVESFRAERALGVD